MKIYSVNDNEFAAYGKVHTGYDVSDLLSALDKSTPLPDAVGYVPSEAALENTKLFGLLQNNAYGGMPVQLGWCNGHNTKLNCLEYHRDSEFNIGLYDFVLLVAKGMILLTASLIHQRLWLSRLKQEMLSRFMPQHCITLPAMRLRMDVSRWL